MPSIHCVIDNGSKLTEFTMPVFRGKIATLSGCFANETPGERTCVRDPGGECGKAAGSIKNTAVRRKYNTTSRLSGLKSPTTGAIKGRYRDAIRMFCKRNARGAYLCT